MHKTIEKQEEKSFPKCVDLNQMTIQCLVLVVSRVCYFAIPRNSQAYATNISGLIFFLLDLKFKGRVSLSCEEIWGRRKNLRIPSQIDS